MPGMQTLEIVKTQSEGRLRGVTFLAPLTQDHDPAQRELRSSAKARTVKGGEELFRDLPVHDDGELLQLSTSEDLQPRSAVPHLARTNKAHAEGLQFRRQALPSTREHTSTTQGDNSAWRTVVRGSPLQGREGTGSAMRSCFRSSPRHVAPCSRPCFRCAAGLAEVRKLCAAALSGLGVELADSTDADGVVFFPVCTSCPVFSRAADGSRGKPALAEDDLQGTPGRFLLGTLRCRRQSRTLHICSRRNAWLTASTARQLQLSTWRVPIGPHIIILHVCSSACSHSFNRPLQRYIHLSLYFSPSLLTCFSFSSPPFSSFLSSSSFPRVTLFSRSPLLRVSLLITLPPLLPPILPTIPSSSRSTFLSPQSLSRDGTGGTVLVLLHTRALLLRFQR